MNLLLRWKTYLAERSPPAALGIVCIAIALAPMAIERHFHAKLFILAIIAGYGLLAQMRLGDEIKDLDKDRKIHPERPLARGLLSVEEARRGMGFLIFFLLLAGAGLVASGRCLGGAMLAGATIYAWLMYREFFVGASLARDPMIY